MSCMDNFLVAVLQVIAGITAGLILIILFSIHYQNTPSQFSPTSPPDTPHVLWIPREQNFDYDKWLQNGAKDNHAEIVGIGGHKAAVQGVLRGLRGSDLVSARGELQTFNDEYQIQIYGYVPKSSLIEKAQQVLK